MVSLRRPHYAWIICLGGALSLFAVMGMGINVFSVYQPYIIQLNGFSNAQGCALKFFAITGGVLQSAPSTCVFLPSVSARLSVAAAPAGRPFPAAPLFLRLVRRSRR